MAVRIRTFLTDETGAVTLDWVVLTALLLATGLSVIATVRGGVENSTLETASQLRGQVVLSSFGSDLCSSGLAGLQALENARVAAGGIEPIDVATFIQTYQSSLDDSALINEYSRLAENGGASDSDGWTRQDTLMGLMECDIVLRGLD